jgi:anti-sigma regulatory factor (Ser/Thr protein kinase)
MERVTLPREEETPRRARHYLAPRLARLGMPPRAADELLVAVGEAVTNAILHGGPLPPDARPAGGVIMIELMARGDRVAVAVTSPGARWHVPRPQLPDDPTTTGGRGLYVMRTLTDFVRIQQSRQGGTVYTTVYLVSWLRSGGSDPGRRPRPGATPSGHRRAG